KDLLVRRSCQAAIGKRNRVVLSTAVAPAAFFGKRRRKERYGAALEVLVRPRRNEAAGRVFAAPAQRRSPPPRLRNQRHRFRIFHVGRLQLAVLKSARFLSLDNVFIDRLRLPSRAL